LAHMIDNIVDKFGAAGPGRYPSRRRALTELMLVVAWSDSIDLLGGTVTVAFVGPGPREQCVIAGVAAADDLIDDPPVGGESSKLGLARFVSAPSIAPFSWTAIPHRGRRARSAPNVTR
jgi:hypothetical protein